MKRLLIDLLFLLLLSLALTGCRAPSVSSDPPPPAEVSESPPSSDTLGVSPGVTQANTPASTPCLSAQAYDRSRPFASLDHRLLVQEGLCPSIAPAEGFSLAFTLPGKVTEEALQGALQLSGAEISQRYFTQSDQETQLYLTIAPGLPGSEVTVQLVGRLGNDGTPIALGFQMRREASPNITATYQLADGPWHQLEAGTLIEPQPLRLRLSLSHPTERESLERWITGLVAQQRDGPGNPSSWEWLDDQNLLIELPEPPPIILLDLNSLRDQRGLQFRESLIHLRTGTPPHLVALDPETGDESVIARAPLDVWRSNLDPDGDWAVLEAVRPTSNYETDLWVIQTTSGETRLTDLNGPSHDGYYWQGDQLIVPAHSAVQVWDLVNQAKQLYASEAARLTALSPDQRYLAGFTLHMEQEDPLTWLAPLTLVIHDLTTHTEQRFSDLLTFPVPHKDGPWSIPLRWSADSQQLFIRHYTGGPTRQDLQSHWAALELASGRIEPATAEPPQIANPSWQDPIYAKTGWAYFQTDWGEIRLRSPEGVESIQGHGWPIGWRKDGRLLLIRWPEADHGRHLGI